MFDATFALEGVEKRVAKGDRVVFDGCKYYRLLAHGFLTPTAVASYIVRVLHGASSADSAQLRGSVLAHTRWVGIRLYALYILGFNEYYGGYSGCSTRRQHVLV